MDLEVAAFLPGEDGLVGEVGDEEDVFTLFEGQRGGLPQDGEYNLGLPLFVHPQDVSVLRHAVNLLLDDNGASQLVAVGGDCLTILKVLPVHTH